MIDLNRREQAVLDAITTSVRERGYPPSVREIGDTVGLSSLSSVAYVLSTLEGKGAIRRVHGQPRAITVLDREAAS